jgi:hypothetical protein
VKLKAGYEAEIERGLYVAALRVRSQTIAR